MQIVRQSFVLWTLVVSTPIWASTVVSLQPSTTVVSPGQTFSLSVGISGASDLYAFQLDFAFDPVILSALSVSEGPFLLTGGPTIFLPGTIDNLGGTISANADTLESSVPGVTGAGTLLTLSFQALASGSSTVQIDNPIALNSFGEGLVVSTAASIVTVNSATPEPGTFLLFVMGAIGLVMLAWESRRSSRLLKNEL